jgi:hypothetical protein
MTPVVIAASKARQMGLLQVLGNYQVERLTNRLCNAVTEEGGGGSVPQRDDSGSVSIDDGICNLFKDRSIQ